MNIPAWNPPLRYPTLLPWTPNNTTLTQSPHHITSDTNHHQRTLLLPETQLPSLPSFTHHLPPPRPSLPTQAHVSPETCTAGWVSSSVLTSSGVSSAGMVMTRAQGRIQQHSSPPLSSAASLLDACLHLLVVTVHSLSVYLRWSIICRYYLESRYLS